RELVFVPPPAHRSERRAGLSGSDNRVDGLGQQRWVALAPHETDASNRHGNSRRAVGNNRNAHRHRFHERHAKTFMLAGYHKDMRYRVVSLERSVGDFAHEDDRPLQLKMLHNPAQQWIISVNRLLFFADDEDRAKGM